MYYNDTPDIELLPVLVPASIDEETYRSHTWSAVQDAKLGGIDVAVAANASANSSSYIIGNVDAKLMAKAYKDVFKEIKDIVFSTNTIDAGYNTAMSEVYMIFLNTIAE